MTENLFKLIARGIEIGLYGKYLLDNYSEEEVNELTSRSVQVEILFRYRN